MGQRPWPHGVGLLRIYAELSGVRFSTTFHVANLAHGVLDADWSGLSDAFLQAWRFGYDGHQAPAIWQTHPATLLGSAVAGPKALVNGFILLRFESVPYATSLEENVPIPPAMTVPIQLKSDAPGHFGTGWSFPPWLGLAVLDESRGAVISRNGRAGLIDAYNGLIQCVSEYGGLGQYALCVFHRDGYWDPEVSIRRWYHPVTRVHIRPFAPAILQKRSPGHGRKSKTPRGHYRRLGLGGP